MSGHYFSQPVTFSVIWFMTTLLSSTNCIFIEDFTIIVNKFWQGRRLYQSVTTGEPEYDYAVIGVKDYSVILNT